MGCKLFFDTVNSTNEEPHHEMVVVYVDRRAAVRVSRQVDGLMTTLCDDNPGTILAQVVSTNGRTVLMDCDGTPGRVARE